MEEIVCPQCHSNQISANQKGFNTTNAVLGGISGGNMMGIGLGMMGSGKIIITCLKCGKQFKAGDGSIKISDEQGNVRVEKQFYIDKEKILKRKIRIIAFILLVIMIVGLLVFFNSFG